MADDFTAEDLLEAAQARFGESQLRLRMRGSLTSAPAADEELLKIADSVVGRVRAAASASVGWPLPGKNDEGIPFAQQWPPDLLQRALDLFNYRAFSSYEVISDQERRIGNAAETYFDQVQSGKIGLAIGGDTDISPATPIAARLRDGTSLLTGVPDRTRPNLLDTFRGEAWDFTTR